MCVHLSLCVSFSGALLFKLPTFLISGVDFCVGVLTGFMSALVWSHLVSLLWYECVTISVWSGCRSSEQRVCVCHWIPCRSVFLLSACANGAVACPSRLAASAFLALSSAWYIMCVFASFFPRMSAPRGQDLAHVFHSAVPSAYRVLSTSGHSIE